MYAPAVISLLKQNKLKSRRLAPLVSRSSRTFALRGTKNTAAATKGARPSPSPCDNAMTFEHHARYSVPATILIRFHHTHTTHCQM